MVILTKPSLEWVRSAIMPINEPSEKYIKNWLWEQDPDMEQSNLWLLIKEGMTKGQDLFGGIVIRGVYSQYGLDAPRAIHYEPSFWTRGDSYSRAVVQIDGKIIYPKSEPPKMWFLEPICDDNL